MKRRDVCTGTRAELAWMLGGFIVVQVLLGVGVDRFWLRVRDPEYALRLSRLTDRVAEAPSRPLVLILGSSRTGTGLKAGDLNQSSNGNAPLVFNFAIPGSGPMFQQLVLRRLLAEGFRPAHVVLEVLPISMSRRGGTPQEENQLDSARLDAAEVARVYPYYYRPYRLLVRWGMARLLPSDRHQAELCDAIGLDGEGWNRGSAAASLDGFGSRCPSNTPLAPDQLAANVRFALNQYDKALNDSTLADGPLRAFKELLAVCRQAAIPTAVVMPPEGSAFRAREAQFTAIEAEIQLAARQSGARLYDARTWVADGGFRDGHHLSAEGAAIYTQRFGRDVLGPELNRPAVAAATAARQ
jgi:hypothetical protein